MTLAEKEYKNRFQNKKQTTYKKQFDYKPEWLDKEISADVASEEEQAEFLKRLNEYK